MCTVYIKEVRITNFKTHKNVRIKFTEGVNVITGPNGSGKSNIIEAIMFGLGERNPRKLRSTSFEQLIHKGAKDKYLSVLVTISDGEYEYQFKRVITVEGKHKYYYNGKRVSRSTYLSQMLKIGEEGLNFRYIPQGSVLAAATMGPQELRQLIDDILGITEYNERKKVALNMLSEARSKLETILAKTEVLKENINLLFKQIVEANRRNAVDQYINLIEAAKITQDLVKNRKKEEKLGHELSGINNWIVKLNNQIYEINGKIENMKLKIDEMEKDLDRKRGEEYKEIITQLSKIQTEMTKVISDIKRLEFSITVLMRNSKNFNREIRRLEKEIEKIDRKIVEIRKENDVLLKEKKEAEKRKDELQKNVDKLNELLIRYEKEIYDEKEIKNVLRDLSLFFTIEDKVKFLKKEKEYSKTRLNNIKSALRRLEHFKNELKKEKTELNKKLEELVRKRNNINEKIVTIEKEIEKAEELLRTAEKEILRLKIARKHGFQGNYVDDAKFILNLAKDLGISGVIDLLGNKIKGPKDIISILMHILGRRWYAILVKNRVTAYQLSELAMKHNKRVIIIPLDNVKAIHSTKENEEQSIIKYLKYPNYLGPLINQLLQRVLIINNLEEAVKKASEGYDVVDRKARFYIYQGEFYVGEKAAKYTKKVKIQEFEEILSDFKDMIKVRKRDYKEYVRERNSLNVEISEVRSEIESINEIIRTVNHNINILTEILNSYKRRLDDISNELSSCLEKAEISKKDVGIDDFISSLKRLEYKKTEIERELRENRDMLSEINQKIMKIESTIALNNKEISNLEMLKKTYEKRISILKRRIDGILKSKERILQIIKRKKENLNNLRRKEKEFIGIKLKTEKNVKHLVTEIKKLSQLYDDYNKLKYKKHEELSSLEKRKIELEKEISSIIKERKRLIEDREKLGFDYDVFIYDYKLAEKILSELKMETQELGMVNPLAKKEYMTRLEPYKHISTRREELRKEEKAILEFIDDIDKKREAILKEGLKKINQKMNSIFKKVFVDGELRIELEDSENIESGLILNVKLPGKPSLPVASLSGGEKSLVLVTFLIAINAINKDTILLLDEIDAHIDPNNLSKFARALREEGTNNQIIMVSLKPSIIENSDNIIGVTIREGISKVVQLPKEVVKIYGGKRG